MLKRFCSLYATELHLALLLLAAPFVSPAQAMGSPFVSAQKVTSVRAWKKDSSVYHERTKAPNKAVARRNPVESDPDAVAAGANLFDQHCAECHGEMAEGDRKLQVCAPTQCNRPPPEPFSGFSPTESFAAARPSGPSCPSRSAGNSSAI
jgi:hypothetical protein